MLGFMMRICIDFNAVFISLYFAYVSSLLEYADVIQSPNYDIHVNRMESVQKKLFSYLFSYYNVIKFAPYLFQCSVLNIEQLSDRIKNAKLLFVFEVLSGQIDSPKLLSLFNVNVPPRSLRNYSLLRTRNHRTGSFEPTLTMLSSFNKMYYLFDFGQSRFEFFS